MEPQSCDTFVVMGDVTRGGHNIFGKNSDRPNGEVQEVIYQKGCTFPPETKLKVTYIEIDQVSTTYGVILSKPSWMWGAEMGANEYGVCVGNEAVWSKVDSIEDEKLLGMDLLRLSLERSKTAREALSTITSLLDQYGQGGPCSDTNLGLVYHNSYIIVDKTEGWVLETVDKMWAAQKIIKGYRNISNCLTIGSNIDLMSEDLEEKAKKLGLWDGASKFNFKNVFGFEDDDRDRLECGHNLLQNLSQSGDFTIKSMFEVLRTDGIARGVDDGFPTTGSMVSEISGRSDCHWLTGTPDPRESIFKPFIFTDAPTISDFIQSTATSENHPNQVKTRSKKTVDLSHVLYRLHEESLKRQTPDLKLTLHTLEEKYIAKVESIFGNLSKEHLIGADDLFKDCVDAEVKCYQSMQRSSL